MPVKTCSSCNRALTDNYVEFRCPACGKSQIIRCAHCRATAKTYKCRECGFVGP